MAATIDEINAGPDLLKVPAVAKHIPCGEQAVYQLIRSGELPSVSIGRLKFVRAADLIAFLGGQTSPSETAETPAR